MGWREGRMRKLADSNLKAGHRGVRERERGGGDKASPHQSTRKCIQAQDTTTAKTLQHRLSISHRMHFITKLKLTVNMESFCYSL